MLYLHKPLPRLALKLFRGEPAISGFDWNFSPIHTSSPPFSTDVRSAPPLPFTAASTWTWIDHPVSGLHILTLALLRLGFPTAPHLWCLTLPVCTTRRTVLQKVRGSSYNEVPQLVNTGFQVLFHSPPGVLFTFPSQYYALSVTKEYLALRGGPRSFPQGFPCLVVLWILPCRLWFHVRGFHPLWPAFPKPFHYLQRITSAVRTPACTHAGLALSRSLAAT